jgi:hypothetical protein
MNPHAYAIEDSTVEDGTWCAICMDDYEIGKEDPCAKVVNCNYQYHLLRLDGLINYVLPHVDVISCAAYRGYICSRRMI